MAVRANASGESLRRTTGLVDDIAFTVCGWARVINDRSASVDIFTLEDSTSSALHGIYLEWESDGTLSLWWTTGAGVYGEAQFSSHPSASTGWFFFAVSSSGLGSGATSAYWGTSPSNLQKVSSASSRSSFTPALLDFGRGSFDQWMDGRFAALKCWDRELSQAEIEAEMFTVLPRAYSALHAWWPCDDLTLANNGIDYSGNGRALTQSGTLSVEDGPPILWSPGTRQRFAVAGTAPGVVSGVGNIASSEAFGTAKINQQTRPSAIASTEAFGSALLRLAISPSGIPSLEAIGTHRLNQQIRSAAITTGEVIGAHTVLADGQFVQPGSIGSAEAFGAHRLNLQIRPSALSSAEIVGSARLNLILRLTGIASGEAFGTLKVNQEVRANAIASGEAVGNHIVASGGLIIQPTAIGSAEAFGSDRVNQQIRAQAVATAETFGAGRLVLFVRPSAIGSLEGFGAPRIGRQIRPSGVTGAEAFGLPVLVPGSITLVVTGIAGGEAVGAPLVVLVDSQTPREIFTATGRVFLIDATGRVFTIEATTRPFTFNA